MCQFNLQNQKKQNLFSQADFSLRVMSMINHMHIQNIKKHQQSLLNLSFYSIIIKLRIHDPKR